MKKTNKKSEIIKFDDTSQFGARLLSESKNDYVVLQIEAIEKQGKNEYIAEIIKRSDYEEKDKYIEDYNQRINDLIGKHRISIEHLKVMAEFIDISSMEIDKLVTLLAGIYPPYADKKGIDINMSYHQLMKYIIAWDRDNRR